jgi:hypothetical protein
LSKKRALIELKLRATKFPDSCPVCGGATSAEGTIPAFTRLERLEAKKLSAGSFPSSRVVASTGSMPTFSSPKLLRIPVCDDHALSFEDTKRLRTTMSALSGIFIVVVFLLTAVLLVGLFDTQSLNNGLLTLTLFLGVGAIFTYTFSRPSALERTIEVYDMESDMSMVVLRISNNDYAEELLRLNPMSTKQLKP